MKKQIRFYISLLLELIVFLSSTIGIIICKKDKQSLPKRNHLLKQQICFV